MGFYLLGVHGTTSLFHALRDEGIDLHPGIAMRVRPPATGEQVIQAALAAGVRIEPLLTLSEINGEIAKSARPDVVGGLILGMFAAIAALVVVGPALIQQAATRGPELRTLKVLGLTRSDLTRLGVASGLFVGLADALVAGALAIGLSSLSPFGEARRFDPGLGIGIVVGSALGGAAAVAFWPGWLAARRATATTLRAE